MSKVDELLAKDPALNERIQTMRTLRKTLRGQIMDGMTARTLEDAWKACSDAFDTLNLLEGRG